METTLQRNIVITTYPATSQLVVAGNEFRSPVPNLSPFPKQRMIQTETFQDVVTLVSNVNT